MLDEDRGRELGRGPGGQMMQTMPEDGVRGVVGGEREEKRFWGKGGKGKDEEGKEGRACIGLGALCGSIPPGAITDMPSICTLSGMHPSARCPLKVYRTLRLTLSLSIK